MNKTNMTDFQRTRSKVWFSNPYDDDDDMRGHSWRRQPSSSPESRRVSTGSPSNGSHKSQDSGFSDSESGSPQGSKGSAAAVTNVFADLLSLSTADAASPEAPVAACRVSPSPSPSPSPSSSPSRLSPLPLPSSSPSAAEHCDCPLPACELSRKFTPFRPTAKWYVAADDERTSPRTPNRTCFIVDELPKSGVAALSSTPGSVRSFDGHFDRSENVTVVENVVADEHDDDGGGVGDDPMIIEPPTPFVDRFNDAASADDCCESDGPDTPEHTSTPKSAKDRCCTPRLHYRKELQLRKPKNLLNAFDRYVYS